MEKQSRQERLDYIYIEKLKTKSEKQLNSMRVRLKKDIKKLETQKNRIERKIEDRIKKDNFIKDAFMEKWRTPSKNLLEAIEEIKNGGGVLCKSMEEFDRQMAEG